MESRLTSPHRAQIPETVMACALIPAPRNAAEQTRSRRRAGRIENHSLVGNMRSATLVDRDGAVAKTVEVAWAHEALVPESHAQALMPLARFATAVRTVLWELRAEGTLYKHSPPCPPAGASDHLAACVHVAYPAAGWSMLCSGLILFEDAGYLLPSGNVFGPRRSLPCETVMRCPPFPRLPDSPWACVFFPRGPPTTTSTGRADS
ncbi:DUF5999 family protein [Streptomyces sp. NPDC007000]|uniref:DUF5999 family protein n=1 Tax=Streptomyces sp. NPDC007000 TaxID=3155357 RepID=UPI0034036582